MTVKEISYSEGLLIPYQDHGGRELFAASRFTVDPELVRVLEPQEYPQDEAFLKDRSMSYMLRVENDGTGTWIVTPSRDDARLVEIRGSDKALKKGVQEFKLDQNESVLALVLEGADRSVRLMKAFMWSPETSTQG